jgi:hypothetical protein
MNCDEAFDCLTDPLHSSRAELEWHLSQCPRCRQMEETLRPALSLFVELPEDDPGARPLIHRPAADHPMADGIDAGSYGDSTSNRPRGRNPRRCESPAGSRAPSSPSASHGQPVWRRISQLAVAAVLGGVLVWQFAGVSDTSRRSDVQAGAAPVSCLWRSPELAHEMDQQSVVVSCVTCHLQRGGHLPR